MSTQKNAKEQTNLADSYRREGEKAIESKVDAAVEQVRADAQALETTANVLRQVERFHDTARFLDGMAQGMRLAAGRMPDTCPF